jgi:prepilin peptidase CpaA
MTHATLLLSVSVLLVLLGMAVASDVRRRRIANRLVLCGLLLALALHALALSGGSAGLAGSTVWAPLAGLLAGGLALLPLYLLRACGAGDVKLMAVVGAFVGPSAALVAALCTLVAGGVLSLAFMIARGIAARTLANLRGMVAAWSAGLRTGHGVQLPPPLDATAARLPYAVAIACGTVCALAWHAPG